MLTGERFGDLKTKSFQPCVEFDLEYGQIPHVSPTLPGGGEGVSGASLIGEL